MIKRSRVKSGVRVQFVLPEAQVPGPVSVVGEFNGWDPGALPLRRRAGGVRSASVVLEPGRQYAFRYLTKDGRWYDDEAADGMVPNGLGGSNSLLSL
ncbi:MAG TPA: isoamylase early set domain-containing protein [Actinomycetes bacterium]|nr:isoamylase early set domain-containing protein [Actinomycetes bacterium]